MTRITLALAAVAVALAVQSAVAAGAQRQEANKKVVAEHYDKAINQKDFETASKYLGSRYTQHDPNAPDGPEGLKPFLQFLMEKSRGSRSEIKRVFADGEYVILHVHSAREPGTQGNAILDIFKLENGKLVERWDARQPVPVKTANSNGIF